MSDGHKELQVVYLTRHGESTAKSDSIDLSLLPFKALLCKADKTTKRRHIMTTAAFWGEKKFRLFALYEVFVAWLIMFENYLTRIVRITKMRPLS